LERIGQPPIPNERIVDTLALARRRHPMGPNSLDALCRRYGIDNSHRTLHGALLDSEILAEVYIELIGGKQAALGLTIESESGSGASREDTVIVIGARPAPLPSRLTPVQAAAHAALVEKIGSKALWAKFAVEAGE
jgi:DNA polymerase-3 subunit epsilon